MSEDKNILPTGLLVFIGAAAVVGYVLAVAAGIAAPLP